MYSLWNSKGFLFCLELTEAEESQQGGWKFKAPPVFVCQQNNTNIRQSSEKKKKSEFNWWINSAWSGITLKTPLGMRKTQPWAQRAELGKVNLLFLLFLHLRDSSGGNSRVRIPELISQSPAGHHREGFRECSSKHESKHWWRSWECSEIGGKTE